VTVVGRRGSKAWIRRTHALLGVISACNLLLLISTGLLLQHATALHLDEHNISRLLLPSSYRPQDWDFGVRADIVVADLHSGRILGTIGALALDAITLAWLVMLVTGLLMYSLKRNGRALNGEAAEPKDQSNGDG
jgi:uncharacterized iron-regulated membrane protein